MEPDGTLLRISHVHAVKNPLKMVGTREGETQKVIGQTFYQIQNGQSDFFYL